jgi:signal transduction histidine kinase
VVCDDGRVLRRLVLCAVGFVAGVAAWSIATDNAEYSFAGRSWVGVLALVGAGWALTGAAALMSTRLNRGVLTVVVFAAGVVWFASEWGAPMVGSSLLFTAGLMIAGLCPALVVWVMLGYPSGRLASWAERIMVAAATVAGVVGVGLLPSMYFDPAAGACARCAANLLAIRDDPARSVDLGGTGLRWAGYVTGVTVAAGVWKLVRASSARRQLIAPVVVPCAAYLAVVAWSYVADADVGFLGTGARERQRWFAEAAALAAIAGGIAWGEWRARRMRSVVAGISLRLGRSGGDGGVRDAIARILGDPELDLVYSVGDGEHVTADGFPAQLRPSDGRTVTPLVSGGLRVASLVHRRGLLDNPVLVEEVVVAASLALEYERLHAELLAQERELRLSRARVVGAGDSERRRLERNLHDGSQQRLIGLLLSARYAQSLVGPCAGAAVQTRVDRLVAELELSIEDLRRVAHGIHPAVLTDEGLAAAIESLADDVDTLSIGPIPNGRFPAPIEQVAYRVVAEAAAAGPARVCAARVDGTLVVDVESERLPADFVDVEDRVSAAEGVITTGQAIDGTVTMKVELPCG